MPRYIVYKEEIIVIHVNSRPIFGEMIEDAMRQGYVPYGDPQFVNNNDYIAFMMKQNLKAHLVSGGDIRSYISEVDQARRLISDKKFAEAQEKEASDGAERNRKDTPEVPFG